MGEHGGGLFARGLLANLLQQKIIEAVFFAFFWRRKLQQQRR